MDSITKMVGIIETALLSIEEVTEPSPIDMLYALQDRLEAAETAVGMMAAAACPALEMSPEDPVGMAHSVVAEVERLRADYRSYQDEIGSIFLAAGQTPYRICKQIWALHADRLTKLVMEAEAI